MTAGAYDPDPLGSASDRHMARHLTAPFAGGAQETVLTIGSNGSVSFVRPTGAALLLAAPLAPLDTETLALSTNDPSLHPLIFDPYTEAGAWLPLSAAAPITPPITLTLVRDGVPVAPNRIAELIEVRLLEGVLASVLYLLGAEKQRIRRQARELSAMRLLGRARDDALDRVGADVSVPRFTDTIAYDPASQEIITRARGGPGGLEPDAEYRRRLAIYKPLLMPTYRRVDEMVNGTSDDTKPNSGPLHQIDPSLTQRFQIVEDFRPFAIAIHIVGTTANSAVGTAMRQNLLSYVRDTYLVWPLNTQAGNDAHSSRLLPAQQKAAITDLRARLRAAYSFAATAGPNPTLAPLLASALDRVARCRQAIHAAIAGAPALTPLQITVAQQDGGGSRYELGLGVNITVPGDLNQLAAAQPHATSADPEVQALLGAMTPAPTSSDSEGRWLFEPCGLQTVYRLDASTLYVSHLPNFGLLIDSAGSPGDTALAAGWALMVPGDFGGPTGRDILAYDRLNAVGQFYSVATDGTLTKMGTDKTGWRQGWSIIVAGRFGAGPHDNLLFYDPEAGIGQFYSYNGAADAFVLLNTQTGWRTTWSHIVAGSFGGSGAASDLLFYDQQNGEIEFYTVASGGLVRLAPTITGVRRTWSHVAAGAFTKSSQAAAQQTSDLFFYDRDTGLGEIDQLDQSGALSLVGAHPGLGGGWTHVLAASFTGGDLTDLLFYNSRTGTSQLAISQNAGTLATSAAAVWSPGWTHLLAGMWSSSTNVDVLAYDRARDRAACGHVQPGNAATQSRPEFVVYRGIQVDVLAPTTTPKPNPYQAHYNAPLSGSNVVLAEGLAAVSTAWTSAGHQPLTVLTKAAGAAAWGSAQLVAPARLAFLAAGLPDVADPTRLPAELGTVPPELLDTIKLDTALATQVLAQGGVGDLQTLVSLLRDNNLGSVLAFADAIDVFVVVGVVSLPRVGLNLAERAPAGFGWYSVELAGLPARVSGSSLPATSLVAADDGLTALVAIAYARTQHLADPYEYRVDLPQGATLNLLQYEFLMNLLDWAHPAGVGVNTQAIRDHHVKLNDSVAPLPPSIWSTFRSFRHLRGRGVTFQPAPAPNAQQGVWASLGGQVSGALQAVAGQDGHLEIFTIGFGGDLRRLRQNAPNGPWREWESLGQPTGLPLGGTLAAARNRDGRLEVFAGVSDGTLWHISEAAPGGPWSGWSSLNGQLSGSVAVAVNTDGRLEVLIRGSDGAAHNISQTAAGANTWSAWNSLGGTVQPGLAIIANRDGRLEAFVPWNDNTVSHASQAAPGGTWSVWATLGGNAQNALAVASNSDGRLEAFAVAGGSSDGQLMHAWQTTAGGTWSNWNLLGGSFGTVLAVAANQDKRLDAVGGGPGNTICELAQTVPNTTTSWTAPVALRAEVHDLITLAANADGRLEVFIRGFGNQLHHLAQSEPNGSWGGS
jgi:hypothetical protein